MKLRSLLFISAFLGAGLLSGQRGEAQSAAAEAYLNPPATTLDPVQIEDLLRQAHDLEGNDTALALQKTREALAGAQGPASRPLELRGLLQLGRLQRLLNDYPGALRTAEDGLTLARTLGDQHIVGELFLLRGFTEWNQSKIPEATVSMMEAFHLGEVLHDDPLRVGALYGRGIVRGRVDDLTGALANLEAALQLAETTNDARLGPVLNSLGNFQLQRKDYPHAKESFERALAVLKDGTNQRTFAYALLNLGQVATETGDQDAAVRYLDASMSLCERYQFRRGLADIAYLRGARERRLGHPDAAGRELDTALALAEKLGNPDLFVSIYEEYVQTEQARGTTGPLWSIPASSRKNWKSSGARNPAARHRRSRRATRLSITPGSSRPSSAPTTCSRRISPSTKPDWRRCDGSCSASCWAGSRWARSPAASAPMPCWPGSCSPKSGPPRPSWRSPTPGKPNCLSSPGVTSTKAKPGSAALSSKARSGWRWSDLTAAGCASTRRCARSLATRRRNCSRAIFSPSRIPPTSPPTSGWRRESSRGKSTVIRWRNAISTRTDTRSGSGWT